jgi:hypothetical protein
MAVFFSGDRLGKWKTGAHEWNRTIDLFLTKEVLYRLSYVSVKFISAAFHDGELQTSIHAGLFN